MFESDPILEILPNIDSLLFGSSQPMAQRNANQPQQPRAFGWNPYGPLDFSGVVRQRHYMQTKTLKCLPRFSGDNVITTIEHLEVLEKAFSNNEVTHEDVVMKLLANTLDSTTHHWFKALRNNLILGYDDSVQKIKEEWDCKYNDKFLLR